LTPHFIRRIGPYSLLELLGRGSMGVVYKAHDSHQDRFVAIKTLAAEFHDDSKLRETFYREARLAAKLDHPNIVRIFDLGEDGSEIFLAMEYLDGKDLKHVLRNKPQIELNQKLKWMIQLSHAVKYAHNAGIIHSDIKPGNLHICNDSRLVVMDFGIARAAGAPYTRPGAVTGTPDYIAPEQILAVRTDHRADIFSMGIVFYELLTGKHPFRSKNLPETIDRILNEKPIAPQTLNERIPTWLNDIVMKTIERNVNSRYQNCKELLQALEST
jgi:serine/threonine protein kinase